MIETHFIEHLIAITEIGVLSKIKLNQIHWEKFYKNNVFSYFSDEFTLKNEL